MNTQRSISNDRYARPAPHRLLLSLLLISLVSSCASQPLSNPESSSGTPATVEDTRIEISYYLGRSPRRFIAESKENHVVAQSILDKTVMREGEVDSARYQDFLQQACNFMRKGKREPSGELLAGCRDPFTITFTNPRETRTLTGCRSHSGEEGNLGRLLREGEFLLYSKK